VDINPRAVETARRNARLNGLEGRITLIESSWERVRGCWDLVLANLTPCPSDELSERLCGWIRPEGLAILSGFGREQGRELEASCVSRGLRPQRMSHQEDWAALVVSALRPEGRSGESAGENRFPSQR
jgi:ribosomal protein L11 methylase PrmA